MRQPAAKTLLVVAVAIAVWAVVAGTAYFLDADRRETLRHNQERVDSAARLLEEHARRTIHAADLILSQALEMIADRQGLDHLGGDDDWKVFGGLAEHLPERGGVWIFDAQGKVVLGNLRSTVQPVNVASRPYFQAHLSGGERFHIGPAIRAQATGHTIFTVSRASLGADGHVDGVVVVGLDTRYFARMQGLLDDDLMPLLAIRRVDGGVLVQYPLAATVVDHLSADDLARRGGGQLMAERRLADLPLVVVAGVDKAAALAPWRARALWLGGLAGGVGLVLTALGIFGWRLLSRDALGRAALERARARLAEAIECLPDGFALFDAEGRLVVCNTPYRSTFQTHADIIRPGAPFEEIVRAKAECGRSGDAGTEDRMTGRMARHGALAWVHEFQIADGRWLKVTERATTEGGRVGLRVDITEDKRRENDLRELARRNALFAAAIEASPNAIIIVDALALDPIVLFVNRAFTSLTGYGPDEILGHSIGILYGPETDVAAVADVSAALARARTFNVEILNYRKDGRPFWNRLGVGPVRDEGGRIFAHVAVLCDVGEDRRREAEERQRQKLEGLGQLAGGLAHEINNLLQPIISLAGLNLRHPGDLEATRADLADILDSARQCRDVVASVLAFARRDASAAPEPTCLAATIRQALTFIRNAFSPSTEIVEDIRVEPAIAPVGRTELVQVLTNLLTNAVDAIDESGVVTVTLERAESEGAGKGPAEAPTAGFRLRVVDRGRGMDAEERQRIFEPFYTTKPIGRGTGLGLSVVHGIVRGWGGSIAIDSAKGRGTAVEILIPARVRPAPVGDGAGAEPSE